MYLSVQLENIRRKHNYLPLIMEVLKILAKRGELVTLYEQVSNHPVRVWTSVTTRGEFFFILKNWVCIDAVHGYTYPVRFCLGV